MEYLRDEAQKDKTGHTDKRSIAAAEWRHTRATQAISRRGAERWIFTRRHEMPLLFRLHNTNDRKGVVNRVYLLTHILILT